MRLGNAVDATYFSTGQADVTVNVFQASPQVPVNPVSFVYGTEFANSQLSGKATAIVGGVPINIPGSFTYTSNEGTVLSIGKWTEQVTFTPTDSTDFSSVVTTVAVTVKGS
jgi:hypothetical protein